MTACSCRANDTPQIIPPQSLLRTVRMFISREIRVPRTRVWLMPDGKGHVQIATCAEFFTLAPTTVLKRFH
jgi:hypothetical protein